MIEKLIKLANDLDELNLTAEAAEVDELIKMADMSFNGAVIAIWAPKSVQDKFEDMKISGKVDLDSMHVTLIYMGPASELDEKKRERIIKACEKLCKEVAPLKARISGFGKFLNEDETVIYAGVDAVGLNELRADLSEAIGKIVDFPNEHGFTPHMTLAYPKSKNTQLPKLEEMPKWKISKIVIAFGKEKINVPLEGTDEL